MTYVCSGNWSYNGVVYQVNSDGHYIFFFLQIQDKMLNLEQVKLCIMDMHEY